MHMFNLFEILFLLFPVLQDTFINLYITIYLFIIMPITLSAILWKEFFKYSIYDKTYKTE